MNSKIYSCVKGTCIPLANVNDETFKSGMLGKGVAIIPKDGTIVSPIDGSVSMVFDTKHALGICTAEGMEVMIHVGLDTVSLKGKHFEVLVKEGDTIKVGQPLIQFDLEEVSKTHDTTTMLIVTNSDDYPNIETMNEDKEVTNQSAVIEVKSEVASEVNNTANKAEAKGGKSELEQLKAKKPKTNSKVLAWFQAFGRALMLPIAIIAAVGIFYGFTAALSRPQVADMLPFMSNEYASYILLTIRTLCGKVFDLIPVLFAISIALGLAKKEKEIAAMAGFIGYYVLLSSSALMVNSGLFDFGTVGLGSPLGITGTLEMGAVGGMIAGILVAHLHNKYYKIELPVALAFFGGKRFVAIAVIVASFLLGQVMPLIWMPISAGINAVGLGIASLGDLGVFIYGALERLLIPTGLHHILNGIFRTTAAGGVYEGVEGVWNIFFEFFGTVSIEELKPFTVFMAQGKIPYMMFGLPAAALGIYHATPMAKRKKVKPLLIAGALASFTTGITEPLEFSFLFIAPILFVFHALMAGLSFLLMAVLNVGIGNTQGGVIDLFVYGVLVPDSNWIYAVLLGIVYAVVYYFIFKWYFTKKNLVIEAGSDEEEEAEGADIGNVEAKYLKIIDGLGGIENIEEINNCFTRLRVDVKDMNKVSEATLKQTGCMGISIVSDTHIQVIYGPKVDNIASKLKELV